MNARLSLVQQQAIVGEALMALPVLFTACLYQPKAKIEAASLIQPNQRMQENPRAEQFPVPSALPSTKNNSGSVNKLDNRIQPNRTAEQKSEIEEM